MTTDWNVSCVWLWNHQNYFFMIEFKRVWVGTSAYIYLKHKLLWTAFENETKCWHPSNYWLDSDNNNNIVSNFSDQWENEKTPLCFARSMNNEQWKMDFFFKFRHIFMTNEQLIVSSQTIEYASVREMREWNSVENVWIE